MNSYYYQGPMVKSSTVRSVIKAENGKEQGFLERFYKTFFHNLFDMWIGENKFLCSYRAFNPDNTKVIEAHKKNHKFKRPEYILEYLEGELKGESFLARQKGLDIVTPEYIINGNSIELVTKKAMFDWVKFYENGEEIARWKFAIKDKFKVYIEIEENATIQDPKFYAVYGQMLYYVGD